MPKQKIKEIENRLKEIKKKYGDLTLREAGISGIAFRMGEKAKEKETENLHNDFLKMSKLCEKAQNELRIKEKETSEKVEELKRELKDVADMFILDESSYWDEYPEKHVEKIVDKYFQKNQSPQEIKKDKINVTLGRGKSISSIQKPVPKDAPNQSPQVAVPTIKDDVHLKSGHNRSVDTNQSQGRDNRQRMRESRSPDNIENDDFYMDDEMFPNHMCSQTKPLEVIKKSQKDGIAIVEVEKQPAKDKTANTPSNHTLKSEKVIPSRAEGEIEKPSDTPNGCGKGDCGNCNPFTGEVMLHPECQKKTSNEGYSEDWKHGIIHLNTKTKEIHIDGDYSIRNYIECKKKTPKGEDKKR